MKRKEDIYHKPEHRLADYAAIALIVVTVAMFLGFEVYTSFNEDTLILAQKDKCQQVTTSIQTTKPTEFPLDIKDLSVQTVAIVKVLPPKEINKISNETKVVKKKNPLAEILQIADEKQALKLQNTFKEFSSDDKNKLLIHAVENNHFNNLALMLNNKYRFTTGQYTGDVHKLIATRKYQVVMLLIQKNLIDIKQKNPYGYTLLHEAAAKGHQRLIRLMVQKGLDVNAQAKGGVSALHYPTRLGYSITVATLLELGINPNFQATLKYQGLYWNLSTPLHIATKKGDLKIIKKLLDAKADMYLKDGDGMTALDWAKKLDHKAVIQLLESRLPKKIEVKEPVVEKVEVPATLTTPSIDDNKTEDQNKTLSSANISDDIKIDEIENVSAGLENEIIESLNDKALDLNNSHILKNNE